MLMNKKVIIGITGGFSSGKSTVAGFFVEKGASKIDADEIGHVILRESADVRNAVVSAFGEDILERGRIDRKKLREKAFADEAHLRLLNEITHPVIIRRINEEIEKFSGRILLIDAPLLFETGLEKAFDKVIVVNAGHDAMVERAVSKGFSREEAEIIIAAQMPAGEKIARADYIIENNGDFNKIKEGVDRIWKEIQEV